MSESRVGPLTALVAVLLATGLVGCGSKTRPTLPAHGPSTPASQPAPQPEAQPAPGGEPEPEGPEWTIPDPEPIPGRVVHPDNQLIIDGEPVAPGAVAINCWTGNSLDISADDPSYGNVLIFVYDLTTSPGSTFSAEASPGGPPLVGSVTDFVVTRPSDTSYELTGTVDVLMADDLELTIVAECGG